MRLVVVILSVVLLAWAPSTIFAQGLWATGCGPTSCAPAKKALSPALYVGYASTGQQGRGYTVAYDPVAGSTAFWNYRWNIGFYGLQLAAEVPFQASDAVTISVSGSWLVPFKGHGVEERVFAGVAASQSREWNAKPQWYTANAAAEYKVNESTALIGGFMYDNTDVSFTNPDAIALFGWRPDDYANVKLSTYIPYLGLSAAFGGFSSGLVFTPFVFGTAKITYNETFGGVPAFWETSGALSNGYFLQTWFEFNTTRAGANLGVYAAYSLLHAKAATSLDVTSVAVNPALSGDYNVTIDRPIWMFGAKFAISFDLPLLPRGLY